MAALKKKKPTVKEKVQVWLNGHNAVACLCVGTFAACAVTGLFLFVVFSGFGASADFIYNQF